MKTLVTICLLLTGTVAVGNAQEKAVKAAPAQCPSFEAGGTSIVLPSPIREMREVGTDYRPFMGTFVPSCNRLVAAYLLKTDLMKLAQKPDNFLLSRYAMVEVPRQAEDRDCSASDFKEVTAGAEEQFGKIIDSSMKDAEEEFSRRMKSLNLNELSLTLGKPVQLGCLFSKPDAYGFGLIVPLSMAGTCTKMAMGGALIRVKQRLLFVYLYAEYENEETVKWLRKATEGWADAILKANQ
jgi:hypothetical protein